MTISSLTEKKGRSSLVATAAICAALYAVANALTSFISTPFGIGEFRPGIVIPIFFAIVSGPLPAAIGASVGSFVGDMVSLVPEARSNIVWALAGGALGNFLGLLVLGWIFQKLKNWKGFIIGTTIGLVVGNVVASAGVVLTGLYILPASFTQLGFSTTYANGLFGLHGGVASLIFLGLFLFWFGTMFPFAVILDPILVRLARPYASRLSVSGDYPEIAEPNRKVVWTWSIIVALLVIGALLVALFSNSPIVAGDGGALAWEVLFIFSAIAVILVGAFLPQISRQKQEPKQKVTVSTR